ncbi:MAG: FkbM family methyltransferase [Gemmatimonadota bacterium]
MSSADTWLWNAARAYAIIRGAVQRTTGLRLKGLGFLLRRLRTIKVFEAFGFRWFLDNRIAGTYASLVSESFLEPETHDFLHHLAGHCDSGFVFVDVGANIGEMVIPMAAHPNCTRVIAFEPHPVCAEVLRQNLSFNKLDNGVVRAVLVGDGTPQPYVIDVAASPNSGIRPNATGVELTPTVRLDDELGDIHNCVLLIDVEGAELDVMRGGQTFIRTSRPLIIFEYHELTRECFSLDDVLEVIGADYELLRLRRDGLLDDTLTSTWNCVAIPRHSVFSAIAASQSATA